MPACGQTDARIQPTMAWPSRATHASHPPQANAFECQAKLPARTAAMPCEHKQGVGITGARLQQPDSRCLRIEQMRASLVPRRGTGGPPPMLPAGAAAMPCKHGRGLGIPSARLWKPPNTLARSGPDHRVHAHGLAKSTQSSRPCPLTRRRAGRLGVPTPCRASRRGRLPTTMLHCIASAPLGARLGNPASAMAAQGVQTPPPPKELLRHLKDPKEETSHITKRHNGL